VTSVLITGATGFIGRGALAPLLEAGFVVHAVSSRRPLPEGPPGVHWEHSDLLDSAGPGALLERVVPTHLLHLAWYAEPGAFWQSPENLRWVAASLRLLRGFVEQGGRRAVIAGSCAEYEWKEHVRCVEDQTPCRPATLYGTCKHSLRLIAERYAEQEGLALAWGRVFFVFGPGEHPARLGGSIARALALGELAKLSEGTQVRDFLYSEDLAKAFVALLRSDVEGTVNMASGTPASVRDLAEALAAAAGRRDLLRIGARPVSPGEPAELVASVDRLRDQVGWNPDASLEQRAADTIAWWRSQLTDGDRPPALS
jgi:nucleoside-diphosphate-sugar epimerase